MPWQPCNAWIRHFDSVDPIEALHAYTGTRGVLVRAPLSGSSSHRTRTLFSSKRGDEPRVQQFELAPLLDGVDTLFLDATFYSGGELPGRDLSKIGHPLVQDSLERFKHEVGSGELRVVFIHMNHSNPLLNPDSAAVHSVRQAGFEVARRGMRLSL